MQILTFAEFKQAAAELEAVSREASEIMKRLGGGSGPMGITPDRIKFSREYQDAHSQCSTALRALRRLNGIYTKMYRRELQAERVSAWAAKLAEKEKKDGVRAPEGVVRAPEVIIQTAADRVETLGRPEVIRVLDACSEQERKPVARYIVKQRPDLIGEIAYYWAEILPMEVHLDTAQCIAGPDNRCILCRQSTAA